MTVDELLETMRAYFKSKVPADVLANLADASPRAYLKESLDVVDFIVHLEDELGTEIDINEAGKALLSSTFRELAEEIVRRLGDAETAQASA